MIPLLSIDMFSLGLNEHESAMQCDAMLRASLNIVSLDPSSHNSSQGWHHKGLSAEVLAFAVQDLTSEEAS
jgi:hypothetical protein